MSSYNGWKNRDTWLANLWLSNDEATYNEARRVVASDQLLGVSERVTGLALAIIAVTTVKDPFNYRLVDWSEVIAAFRED